MNRLNLLCFLTLCMCFAREPPMVVIPRQGTIMGKEISMIRTQRILAYLAVPYAHPPLDHLRFAPPEIDPLPAWEGIRNATEFAPACVQSEKDFNKADLPFLNLVTDRNYEVDEDCLYLNVFVPYGQRPPEGFATIVWIHPGNFTTGNPATWNPYTLVYRQRVIVITVAYRLGILGFFTTLDGESPGNYGLMDQQAALMWIKTNIELFNGNSNNICLMGYGTGGMSVGLHMTNPQSRNLFTKAIIMSANFFSPAVVKLPSEDKALLDRLAPNFGCFRTPTSSLMECLRRATADSLAKFTSDVDWRPLIDLGLSNSTPPFITDLPRNYFERDDFYSVPFLTGYTDMEDVLDIESLDPQNVPDADISKEFVSSTLSDLVNRDLPPINENDTCSYNYEHISDSVLFFYGPSTPVQDPDTARKLIADFNTEKKVGSSTFLHSTFLSKHQPTYMYRFDMKPSTPAAVSEIPEWVSVPHLFDLIYVWGIPYWPTAQDKDWDTRDKRTSDIIMSFWTNFAKTSNPTENAIYPIRWDAFTKDTPGILIIDKLFNMSDENRLNSKSFTFWNDYYPKVLNIATQCCNATDSAANYYKSNDYYVTSMVFSTILVFRTWR